MAGNETERTEEKGKNQREEKADACSSPSFVTPLKPPRGRVSTVMEFTSLISNFLSFFFVRN